MSLLEMSFYGGVMILAVTVLRTLTVHRLPKRTFVVLWVLALARLLIPFTLPSAASIYSLLQRHESQLPVQLPTVIAPVVNPGTVGNVALPAFPNATTPVETVSTVPDGPTIPVWTLVWLAGVAACGLFFAVVYVKNRREFNTSLPVESEFFQSWLESHSLRRRVQIRQFDRISAPLTYGLVRPVILLPKETDLEDRGTLGYVLEHELVHIKRWDALTKLVLVAAVCLHWFNPLVWVMFFLANRDLELSCDEAVLRTYGENIRGSYAQALIRLEETKSGLTPVYNHFSKSAIEERVVAIMKTRKKSLAAVLTAIVLVVGVTATFATTAGEKAEESPVDWLPTLTAGDIQDVTWSGWYLEGAPQCPDAAEAARLINAAAQNRVDSTTLPDTDSIGLPDSRHGYVVGALNVDLTDGNSVYLTVGTVKDIVWISVGEQFGYFEAPELYRRIAAQNDRPDRVDPEAFALYKDALMVYLAQTMPSGTTIDAVTTDGAVLGHMEWDGGTIIFRKELATLKLFQENTALNAQAWIMEGVLSTDPVDQIGHFGGNGWLDSQFRFHGSGSALEVLVTANGSALGFSDTEFLEYDKGLGQYGTMDELIEALTPIGSLPSLVLDSYDIEPSFGQIAGEYHFLSGAGGWQTMLILNADGTFAGQYLDSEMGSYDPVRYPDGSAYFCDFTGAFRSLYRLDRFTWHMELESLSYLAPGTETISGGIRYITSTPYGLDEADEITVYLPGTPVDRLPQEALSWLSSAPAFWETALRPDTLPFTVLYNEKEREAFFSGSMTEGGDTLSPLSSALYGTNLTWKQEGESLFLYDGDIEVELRAGESYLYRRGYVTAVLPSPPVLQDGVFYLPRSFRSLYLVPGRDCLYGQVMFFKDEVVAALLEPDTPAHQRLLAAISLPRSMSIETIKLDNKRIFGESPLDDYPEALAAELTGMGVPNAHKRAYGEYVVLTEARSVTRAGLAEYFLKDLPDEDPNAWTVRAYKDWQQAQLQEQRITDLNDRERAFVEEHDIQPDDLVIILREFYFNILSYPEEDLRACLENYYQFAISQVLGEVDQ